LFKTFDQFLLLNGSTETHQIAFPGKRIGLLLRVRLKTFKIHYLFSFLHWQLTVSGYILFSLVPTFSESNVM